MTRMAGDGFILREYSWDDQMEMRQWATDQETTKWLGQAYLRPQPYEQTQAYLRSILEGNAAGIHFAIADAKTDRYMGQIDLIKIDSQARHAEMAIVLCPDSQGRGLGRKAVQLMLKCAFMSWNLNRVYLHVDADNLRAIRCYEACGFQIEGRLRADRYREGRYRDTICMGILRKEWEEYQK